MACRCCQYKHCTQDDRKHPNLECDHQESAVPVMLRQVDKRLEMQQMKVACWPSARTSWQIDLLDEVMIKELICKVTDKQDW